MVMQAQTFHTYQCAASSGICQWLQTNRRRPYILSMFSLWHWPVVLIFRIVNHACIAEASELLEKADAKLLSAEFNYIDTPSWSEAALLNMVDSLGWIGAQTNIHPVPIQFQAGLRIPHADLWRKKLTCLTTAVVWNLLAEAPSIQYIAMLRETCCQLSELSQKTRCITPWVFIVLTYLTCLCTLLEVRILWCGGNRARNTAHKYCGALNTEDVKGLCRKGVADSITALRIQSLVFVQARCV